MKNAYEIRGDVTAILLNSPKYGRMETLIDTVDLPRVQELKNTWIPYWSKNVKSFYVLGHLPVNERKRHSVQLHRWLSNAQENEVVDHENHDTLDNRRSTNLRVCSYAENQWNQKTRKGKTSRFKGVSWNKSAKKWVAQVGIDGSVKCLGYFESEVEAAQTYNTEALNCFGRFASLNDVWEVLHA